MAARIDTEYSDERRSSLQRSAIFVDCLGGFHSFVRPAPRAFFRPDRQIAQPPRAGPVKAGRVFAATRRALALIGPSTAARSIGSGLEGARNSRCAGGGRCLTVVMKCRRGWLWL